MTDNFSEENKKKALEHDELTMSTKDEPKQPVIEDKDGVSPGPSQAVDVGELEKSAEEKLKSELSETKDRYLRLAAEFDNFKKISLREQQNSVRFANESLILNLLPIIDNLEQAVVLQKKSSEAQNDILIGVEMVLKQLFDSLAKFGVEVFSAKGVPFDPARHEALCEQEDDTVAPGTVVVEYQKGYLLSGRLLRPARVAVAKTSGSK